MTAPPPDNQPASAQRSSKQPTADPAAASGGGTAAPAVGGTFSARYPWAVFVVPYVVFVAISSLEPAPDSSFEMFGWAIPAVGYPLVYSVKILAVMATMFLLWPGYRQFRWKLSPLALVVGVVGAIAWVALCKLELERFAAELPGMKQLFSFGERSGFDPLAHFADRPFAAYGFLAVRFWGLAVIVPVIEEFFLRGFVMRYFDRTDWWEVPFGTLSRAAIVAGTLVPILTHPMSEFLAVVVWFSMVTWLMWRTRNMWDCVAAHMVTNLLLGVWVVYSGDWYLM